MLIRKQKKKKLNFVFFFPYLLKIFLERIIINCFKINNNKIIK